MLPFFTRIDSGTTFDARFANLLAQDECNEIPQPQHELNSSAVPVGPFDAVPLHSTQTLVLLVFFDDDKNSDRKDREKKIEIKKNIISLIKRLKHL